MQRLKPRTVVETYSAGIKLALVARGEADVYVSTYDTMNDWDLAAGHLLYAIGWAYDLLWPELTSEERARIRASLERHAALVHEYFTPSAKRGRFEFTQNHDFIHAVTEQAPHEVRADEARTADDQDATVDDYAFSPTGLRCVYVCSMPCVL